MRIPDHIIDEVRAASDIVDVIGEHVRLKKMGRNYLGLCPFHNEKTPSFNVNPERGIYKCFGCGKAGNAITFVTEYQHVGFVDAVKILAARAGIVIPEERQDDPTGIHGRKDGAFAALRTAAEFYAQVLTSPGGATANDYFAKRGFTAKTITDFTLGAAPSAWDATILHLRGNGFTDEHMVDAGLVVVREDGRMYDRFRGRAVFTIRDDQGRVVGFSARILADAEGQPKYINSPQGLLFDKSRIVYGLDRAKRKINELRTAIIVEGQADVVSMHQGGFINTVASSGTSLTREHLQLLHRYADTVTLLFDADNAGQQAMTRAIELALSIGFDARVVVLPAGSDPDSIIRDQGADSMQTLLDGAVSFLEFQAERFRNLGLLDDPANQAKAVRTLLQWIASVPDRLRHPFLVRELAERFRLQENFLLRELATVLSAPKPTTSSRSAAPTSRVAEPQQPVDVLPSAPVMLTSERELIRIALTVDHGLAMLMHKYHVTDETFWSEGGRRIFQRIVIAEDEHHDALHPVLNDEELSPTERQEVADIAYSTVKVSAQWERFNVDMPPQEVSLLVRDALVNLHLHRIQHDLASLMRVVDDVGDVDARDRIVYRINDLVIKRETVRNYLKLSPDDPTWLHAVTPSASSSSA